MDSFTLEPRGGAGMSAYGYGPTLEGRLIDVKIDVQDQWNTPHVPLIFRTCGPIASW